MFLPIRLFLWSADILFFPPPPSTAVVWGFHVRRIVREQLEPFPFSPPFPPFSFFLLHSRFREDRPMHLFLPCPLVKRNLLCNVRSIRLVKITFWRVFSVFLSRLVDPRRLVSLPTPPSSPSFDSKCTAPSANTTPFPLSSSRLLSPSLP